jgi:hypothetical protein
MNKGKKNVRGRIGGDEHEDDLHVIAMERDAFAVVGQSVKLFEEPELL